MRTTQRSIEILRPVEGVFDFMLDLSHAAAWRELITRMEWIDGGPRAGATVRMVYWAEGRERSQDAVLSEYDRPRRQTFENHNDGFRSVFQYDLEPTAAGTRVTVTVDVRGDSLAGTLLVPLFRGRHRRRFIRTLERLKAAAEQAV